ncbi:hypothetical protein EEB15_16300 [Ramlibacter sp. WS9]|nr:hypothetical protein EEB15_16300 [Ramlibacter sp. WS9]
MTVGEVLAAVAVMIIALELWMGRQARIVFEEVQARRIAMEAEDRADEERMRRGSSRCVR